MAADKSDTKQSKPVENTRCETRRLVRHRHAVEVTQVTRPNKTPRAPAQGAMLNISSKGAGFSVSAALPIGAAIVIRLLDTFPDERIHAQVRWTREMPTTHRVLTNTPMKWSMGVLFTPQTDEERERLKELTEKL